MLKKILAGALAVVLAVIALPIEAFADTGDVGRYGDFACIELSDGTLSILGYWGEGGEVVIPPEINGKTVTQIGSYAFALCETITSVEIPFGVTLIDCEAFSGSSLVSVDIPDSVVSIGDAAFQHCTHLISVDIPKSVAVIGENAFGGVCKS